MILLESSIFGKCPNSLVYLSRLEYFTEAYSAIAVCLVQTGLVGAVREAHW
jgi:hypothetical protein